MGQIRKTARCSDVILAAAESFDCSVIQLKHTVMSPRGDYAGSNDEGSAGGSVLILKQIKACSTHRAEGMSELALPTNATALYLLESEDLHFHKRPEEFSYSMCEHQ